VIVAEEVRVAARRALGLSDAALLAECEETFFVAGGPGGQHRNKTESGVRLVHGPTGAAVSATERRSQARNRAAALRRLRERLEGLARRPRPRRATRPTPARTSSAIIPVDSSASQRSPRPSRFPESSETIAPSAGASPRGAAHAARAESRAARPLARAASTAAR
jgi:protein subunit release factor B